MYNYSVKIYYSEFSCVEKFFKSYYLAYDYCRFVSRYDSSVRLIVLSFIDNSDSYHVLSTFRFSGNLIV